MPIYNGIEFITESVDSILNQTFNEWELIIGINGHPLNSDVYKTAKKYENEKIKVFDMDTIGKSNTLNEMLKYTNYNFIAILDVDDIWFPLKLEKQIPFIKKYDVVGTKCQYFGDSTSIPNIPVGNLSGFNFLNYNPIINSSSIIRKDLCYWEDDLEDYNLWLKLWKLNYNFFNVNEILVKHRIHKKSAFNNTNGEKVPLLKLKYK